MVPLWHAMWHLVLAFSWVQEGSNHVTHGTLMGGHVDGMTSYEVTSVIYFDGVTLTS